MLWCGCGRAVKSDNYVVVSKYKTVPSGSLTVVIIDLFATYYVLFHFSDKQADKTVTSEISARIRCLKYQGAFLILFERLLRFVKCVPNINKPQLLE